MFGFVVTNPDKLTEAQNARYRGVYCGVCRAMGERQGRAHRMALTYDLVLPVLLFSSVTGTGFEENEIRCSAHPFKKRLVLANEYTAFAADMNILLAFYKFLDDLKDDGGVVPAAEAAVFWDEAQALKEKYPALSKTIDSCLAGIAAAEKRDEREADVPASLFGELLGSIFAYYDLPCRQALYDFGYSLGKVIYFMDAAVDIKADLKKRRYNPLITKTAAERRALLELQLGDCMMKYNQLPLTQDKEITDNILLSGIWTGYEMRNRKASLQREAAAADVNDPEDATDAKEDEI